MAGKIQHQQWIVTVAGTTGSARSPRPIDGRLLSVHLNYSASMAATADVTIVRVTDDDMPTENLLTVNNSATDNWFRPRATLVDDVNSTILDQHDTYAINGYLSAAVVDGTDTETVEITVLYEED